MSREIVPQIGLQDLGEIANQSARKTVLKRYQRGRSSETIRRQTYDVKVFEKYLSEAGYITSGMKDDLSLWEGVSYGIVAAFQQWQLQNGYSIGSVNVRIATIKKYCELANQAEYLSHEEMGKIKNIENIGHKEGRNVDEKRDVSRIGKKKEKTVLLSEPHVELIKKKLRDDPDSARDYLIFCLLADLGLRCGEIADLETKNIDIFTGTLVFYRRKVDKTQTHNLKGDTLEAAKCYFKVNVPGAKLFGGRSNAKTEKSNEDGLTTRAINKIIARIGILVDVKGLSPHDLRHYWATTAIRKGTDVKSLQQAGGWNSPYMPLRYAEESEIANEGVKL